MISCISILSLLVLANRCFALPIVAEQLFNSTANVSFSDEVTDGSTFNPRLFIDHASSVSSDLQKKEAIDEHMGFEIATDGYAARSIDEYSTTESVPSSTEGSIHEKRQHFTMTTDQSFPSSTEESSADKRENGEVTSESLMFTTDSSDNNEDNPQYFFSTTVEPTSQFAEFGRRSFPAENENGLSQVPDEPATDSTIPFRSSSRIVKTSTPTGNDLDSLPDKSDQSANDVKSNRKASSARKSQRYSTEKFQDEHAEDSTFPTAMIDDKALDGVATLPSDFLFLDQNSDLIVTALPGRDSSSSSSSSTTMAYREKEALNQGEESSHSEEEKSNH